MMEDRPDIQIISGFEDPGDSISRGGHYKVSQVLISSIFGLSASILELR